MYQLEKAVSKVADVLLTVWVISVVLLLVLSAVALGVFYWVLMPALQKLIY